MLRIVVSRLGWALFSIWAVVTLAFFLNHTLPTDPARAELGLDESVATQYRRFAARIVHRAPRENEPPKAHATCKAFGPMHVDLGMSYQRRKPVVQIIADRFPRTFWLAVAALFVEVIVGVTFGVIAAVRRGTAYDRAAVTTTLVGISTPTFLIGILLQYVLAYRLRWLPLDGFGTTLSEHLASVVLPALTLGIAGSAYYTRLVRSDMIDALRQDYVRTARAKGVRPFGVVVRHALRNALLPLVTVMGLDLGVLLGGAVVAEKLFRWPGLGQLSVDAVFDRDNPVVLGVVIVTSSAIVLANLAVDLSYALLDPRVRARPH